MVCRKICTGLITEIFHLLRQKFNRLGRYNCLMMACHRKGYKKAEKSDFFHVKQNFRALEDSLSVKYNFCALKEDI